VLEYLDDIHVDLLRFFPQFGPDPLDTLAAPLFFKIAQRLVYYGGATHAALSAAAAGSPVDTSAAAASTDAPAGTEELGPLINGIRAPKGAKAVSWTEMVAEHPDLIGYQRIAG